MSALSREQFVDNMRFMLGIERAAAEKHADLQEQLGCAQWLTVRVDERMPPHTIQLRHMTATISAEAASACGLIINLSNE